MNHNVRILGIGEPGYTAHSSQSLEELVHGAARAALRDAGIERRTVDDVVLCASDLDDGRAISSMVTAGPAGGYRKDVIKTTDTGIHALALAAMKIALPGHDTALVTSWGKPSEAALATTDPLEAEPYYRRDTGLGHLTGHALTTTPHVETTPDAEALAAARVETRTQAAVANPTTDIDTPRTRRAIENSDIVSWPLRTGHLPAHRDGACALIITTEDTDDGIPLEGVGWETDTYDPGTGRLGELPAARGAAQRAYTDAGITNPTADLDLAELHTKTAFHEPLLADALGLPPPEAGGEIAFNQSGGPFAGDALIATGLARVTAAVRQLRGEGSQRPDRAVAHATAGITDQVHGVAVLGGPDT